MQKHKFDSDKKQVSDSKMVAVLADMFLMEAYINEKLQYHNTDSSKAVKSKFYPALFKYHQIDSAKFYSTLSYFQSHPKEFSDLLIGVDSNLYKIKPLDTSRVLIEKKIVTPDNIDNLSSFKEQEEAMRREYLKNNPSLQKLKDKKEKE